MLSIVAIGNTSLRKKAVEIDKDYPNLKELIEKMFETMYASKGVGLAAPQVGKSIRLFIIDARPYSDEAPETKDFVQVFINPKIINESGKEWSFCEGCLSVPSINEDVVRLSDVEIEYYDENFVKHQKSYSGMIARIIQHEYDHLEGILFVDRVSTLKKTLLRSKINKISKGDVDVNYRILFAKK